MNKEILLQELKFKAIRSSGAGGQHVNKVSSKVELTFDVLNSNAFSEFEKELLLQRIGNRLTNEHVLILQVDETRSQHRNKELVKKRLIDLIEKALEVRKKRKKSKPTKSSIEKRLKSKKRAALKKVNRKRPELE